MDFFRSPKRLVGALQSLAATGRLGNMVTTCRLTLLAIFLFTAVRLWGNQSRSVWFWHSSASPYGSANIVGVDVLENQTVAFFGSHAIKRVYGSYQDRPVDEPAVLAAWNAKLQGQGIQSQLLIDGTDYIFPTERPGLIGRIDDRLIAFNGAPGRVGGEKFDALHLDIEPQGLPEWGPPPPTVDLTPTQKRDYLFLLRDTFADVRQHLDDAGLATMPIYADLPVTWEKLPGEGGSIGWTDAAERDQWYDDVAASLTGISLMAFQRYGFSSIDAGVDWERTHLGGATVRVGIQPILGSADWASLPDFNAMLTTLEDAYGASGAVDIENYRRWREAIAAQPILPTYAILKPVDLHGGSLIVDGEPGWNYLLAASSDLCVWRELKRFRFADKGVEKVPVSFEPGSPVRFFSVMRFQDLRER